MTSCETSKLSLVSSVFGWSYLVFCSGNSSDFWDLVVEAIFSTMLGILLSNSSTGFVDYLLLKTGPDRASLPELNTILRLLSLGSKLWSTAGKEVDLCSEGALPWLFCATES